MLWSVAKHLVSIKPHSNADSLEIAKVGANQLVVKKGEMRDGDEVVFIPKDSLLPEVLQAAFPYAREGRVRSVQLRGEISMGIALSLQDVSNFFGEDIQDLLNLAELGEDVSSLLQIEKYEPQIPYHMQGEVDPVPIHVYYSHHDCNQYGTYRDELDFSERVVVTEKLHGSQGIFLFTRADAARADSEWEIRVSSKGMLRKGLVLKPSEGNVYWQALKNSGLAEKVQTLPGNSIQIFTEVIPVQKGYNYGQNRVTLRVFEVRVDGVILPYDAPELTPFRELWVPVVYDGKFGKADLYALSKGKELVSGQALHIREGVVVRPHLDRKAEDGEWLKLKVINPAYKETGEEFN
ncbi:RNA ligase (ATP) [Deinococcus roseus]|uniref:RNA ligase n=1 Tax=Deinococcus roseus TaxID=392414 RepID=A0ABQ2CXW6_9DEIO|nr:RNA ligase (ATP) [Deinococcus roseus]GGJ31565.1 RNA ligase [Deinococcus roseus]